jgi:hypothetical protein
MIVHFVKYSFKFGGVKKKVFSLAKNASLLHFVHFCLSKMIKNFDNICQNLKQNLTVELK